MKIAELKAVVQGMTDGPWKRIRTTVQNSGDVWICHTIESRNGDDNAKGIAALRNHADALIELVEACISVLNQLDVVKNRYAIKELENALQKLENI